MARTFQVRKTEVALLAIQGRSLKFLFPAELRSAGSIPLSSSAVAAKTAQTKKAERYNTFTNVKHSSVFEMVRLGTGEESPDTQVIQKLMTAPILDSGGEVWGVIQISRKGATPAAAGPDFSEADLEKLERSCQSVAKVMPRLEPISR